jgi:hypothetical protein
VNVEQQLSNSNLAVIVIHRAEFIHAKRLRNIGQLGKTYLGRIMAVVKVGWARITLSPSERVKCRSKTNIFTNKMSQI